MTVCECCVCFGAFCLTALCSGPILRGALLPSVLGFASMRKMFILYCHPVSLLCWMQILLGVDVIVAEDNDGDLCNV